MAKKSLEMRDAFLKFVQSINDADNFKTLKSITFKMSNFRYFCHITDGELYEMVESGMKHIMSLLSDVSVNDLQFLKDSASFGIRGFFNEIKKSQKAIINDKKSEEVIQNLNKRIETLEEKLLSAQNRGKFDKVAEYEYKINCFKRPYEMKSEINKRLEKLEDSHNLSEISNEKYNIETKKLENLLKNYVNKALEVEERKKTSSENYVDKIHYSIQVFLNCLFFEKKSAMSKNPNRFLMNYFGELCIDVEHMTVYYNYLKSINYSDIKEIQGIYYYLLLEQFYIDIISLQDLNKIKDNFLVIKDTPMDFTSIKYNCLSRYYTPIYLTPNGYDCYIFEPKNIMQQSFLACVDNKELDLGSMVEKYNESQKKMRERYNGIFFSFLDKDVENRLVCKIASNEFPLQFMDGEYSEILLEEYQERSVKYADYENVETLTHIYNRKVKPLALEVLGSYVRQFCSKVDVNNLESSVFIYYVSPERVAIAIKRDIDKELLEDIFDSRFLKVLKKEEKLTIDKIFSGNYF